MESGPTQAVLPLVGLAAEKVIRDLYNQFQPVALLLDVARLRHCPRLRHCLGISFMSELDNP
ncbi:MAG: hypothetical protein ACQESR_10320 [Planctomycetota bacterium]